MKLASIILDSKAVPAVAVSGDQAVIPVSALLGDDAPTTMSQLIAAGPALLDRLKDGVAANMAQSIPLDAVQWAPPVPDTGNILGVAMNNGKLNANAHINPAGPMFFVKTRSSVIAHGEPIEIAPEYGFTFPELELCVVIGKKGKFISEDDALSHVFGYTIINDITSQGLKKGDSIAVDITPQQRATPGYDDYFSWRNVRDENDLAVFFTYHARSKGSDTFGPMGPWITTADEIADPDNLGVRGFADGELFAEDSTASYSFGIRTIISYASRYFTLMPGDIIHCGTAAKGTEKFPAAHHAIDMSKMTPEVAIEIDGLGRLSNPIRHIRLG